MGHCLPTKTILPHFQVLLLLGRFMCIISYHRYAKSRFGKRIQECQYSNIDVTTAGGSVSF